MNVLSPVSDPVLLDMKDRRILTILATDVRTPLSRIAKAVRLSPESVRYRIAKLKELNVLRGALAFPSATALGVKRYHILFSVSTAQEGECIKQLSNDTHTLALIQYLGHRTFQASLALQHTQELANILRDISNNGAKDITTLLVEETVTAKVLPPGIAIGASEPITVQKTQTSTILDNRDREILITIGDKSDLRIEEVAKQLNIPRDQVAYRLRRLREQRIVRHMRPVINFAVLGFWTHMVLIKLGPRTPQEESRFLQTLRETAGVLWAVRTIGEWDIVLYTLSRDLEGLHQTLTALDSVAPALIARQELLIGYRQHTYRASPIARAALSTPQQPL